MTDMATTYHSGLDESREKLVSSQQTAGTQTLITEQQVLFSTAAAVALPPAKTRWWSHTVHAVRSALRSMFAASEKPPARRHYPKRHVWLDDALMSREMDRL